MRRHFGHFNDIKYQIKKLIHIEEDEMEKAILALEKKKKTHSFDNVSDLIFKKNAYKRMNYKGTTFNDYMEQHQGIVKSKKEKKAAISN